MIETLAFSMIFNIVMFLVAFRYKTDKLTDMSYALTFIGIVAFGVVSNDMTTVKWLMAMVVVAWALRLGGYLLIRIHKMGRDKRFDKRRNSFTAFGGFWLLQGLTSWVVMLPVTLLLGSGATSLELMVAVGLGVSVVGILVEGSADMQKFRFINNRKNKGKWIDTGLWRYSRHPNYFGEILMWIGASLVAYQYIDGIDKLFAAAGPLFIILMLTRVSGIPLLEKSADERWGKDKKYQEYKRNTSVLLLLPKGH